jgi:Zn-dependent protease
VDASVRVGRIAGIEVGLNWSLAIVFVLIVWTLAGQILPSVAPDQQQSAYWLVSVIAVVLFYVSLLSHELGHAIVARRLGVKVDGITLWIFGGVARLRGDAATPAAEVKIAIAGPLVSLALSLLFGAATFALDATGGPVLVEGGIAWLAGTNAMLLLFNLIPAFPLDGGRLLRAWLWQRSGDRYRATSGAARLGRICAFLMIGLGLLSLFINGALSGLWLIFLGWFLMSAARGEESQVLMRGALTGLLVRDVMSRDLTATRVRAQGTGLDEVAKAAPGEQVTEVLDRFSAAADGQILVIDQGELVGLLSPSDITRALKATPARRR